MGLFRADNRRKIADTKLNVFALAIIVRYVTAASEL
jgi:hypothetical protein